jgi:membrane dipeptidase
MGRISLHDRHFADGVAELFRNSLVWDNHVCAPLRLGVTEPLADLRRHKAAGVDVVCINVGFDLAPWGNAIQLLAAFRRWLREHQEEFVLVTGIDDIKSAQRRGRLAVAFNLEGGSCLNGDASMVRLYYDLGVRWMLLAYNRNNALGGGCQDEDRGLTDFGRRVIDEMQRVGMVVCCTHVGHRTAMEVMDYARGPVIFSHSNPRSLCDHPRNIRDEAIRACARTGGVIGINGIGIFLGNNDVRTDTIVQHVDYVASLVGPEHVGIGLDYVYDQRELQDYVSSHPETYPPDQYPAGIRMIGPEQIPDIAARLLERGYAVSDVRKILGENHLRVAGQVWK